MSRQETLRVGLLILKRGSRDGDLRQTLLVLGRAALSIGYDDLVALVRYILAEPNEVEAAVLREVLKEIIPGQETRVMSIAAEQWKAEGFQMREVSGKAKGIEAGKADLLLRQLRRRFGTLPESTQVRVLCAPRGSVERVGRNSSRCIDAGRGLWSAQDQLTQVGNSAVASA